MMSPVPSTYTSTEGSDRFNFFKPYNNFAESFISGVDTLTFKIDFVCDETGTKDIQSSVVEIVPDLKISPSKPAIPTTQPAEAALMPSGYCPLKKYSPVILALVISGISIIYPFSPSTFFGFTPITRISWFRLIVPEKIRAKPNTRESSSIVPSPLSLICFLGMVIILETNPIKGTYSLLLHIYKAFVIAGLSFSSLRFNCNR